MDNYCSNCGNKIEQDATFCSKCGMRINQDNKVNGQIQYVNVRNNKPDGLSTAGFIIGIISLFINLCGIMGFLAFILSCVGLAQTPKTDKKGRSRATSGIVLGIVGIIWGIYQVSRLFGYM